MRVSDRMNYDQVKNGLAKNRSELGDLQSQAATQKRIIKPSDDPLGATRVLQTRSEIAGGAQFLKSINNAKTFMSYSEQSMADLTEVLSRAKELAIGQANDPSTNAQSRAAVAAEVDQLFNQAVQIGNRKLADRFLFGGFKTTRAPFANDGTYHGDNGEIKISIQKEGSVAMNIPGSRIFLGGDAKAPADAGPGPAQTLGKEPPPEPRPGEKNSDGTIREPASLPGERAGRAVEEEHARHEANGEEREQAPEIQRNLTQDFNKNGVNVFHVLQNLSTSLKADDKEGVQESLDRLDSAMTQVTLSRSQIGGRMSTLNITNESISKDQVEAKALASSIEDSDAIELMSDMTKSESTLKATLATSGKLIQQSLLDFIR